MTTRMVVKPVSYPTPWIGPHVVRVVPERPLRYVIGVAGLGLAGYLWLG